MKHTLNYNCIVYTDYYPEYINLYDYSYVVEEKLDDVVDYLFLKKYNKKYKKNLSWCLEEGAVEFVKDIENKWWHNELDTYELYQDSDFINYLKDVYLKDAAREYITENDLTFTSDNYDDLYE